MQKDLLLIFPPLTEARLFPYLSLPMITSFLRNKNHKTAQLDLNMDLSHNLFNKNIFRRYLENEKRRNDSTLKHVYREKMVTYLIDNHDSFYKTIFEKKISNTSNIYSNNCNRFVRHGIELMLENSILSEENYSLTEMITKLNDKKQSVKDDIALNETLKILEKELNKHQPKIVGFSIAYFSQIFPTLILSKWIKENFPNTLVVLGGQQVMLRKEDILKLKDRLPIDALGVSAGEETLHYLIEATKKNTSFAEIPDIIWTKSEDRPINNQIKSMYRITDALPPDFSDLSYKKYLSDEVHMSLITCVGCYWGRCAFCSYGNRSKKGNSYQQKSPKQIAKECKEIVDNYGIHRINFVDENTNLILVLNAAKILKSDGYDISFSTRNRLENSLLKKEFCEDLKKNGCVLMSCGYETNSQRILDLLDKGVESANYQKIIDNLHDVGIPLRLSVIGGLPNETKEEFENSKIFLEKNAHKIGIDVMQMLVLEPNTFLSENPKEYGISVDVNDSQMRGNSLLNYGMGRVGSKFKHENGDTFEDRLSQFIKIHKSVIPEKNDELPPSERDNLDSYSGKNWALYPWISAYTNPVKDQWYLFDLLWQKVYKYPSVIKNISLKKYIESEPSEDVIEMLYKCNLIYEKGEFENKKNYIGGHI